jgi:HTH-type transcriptional regulator/antitoxin HigA
MTSAAGKNLDALAQAWRELQARTAVKFGTVDSARHYRGLANLMNKLVDEIGDRETHPLMGLLDIVTLFVRDYEERTVEIPDAEPAAVLRFLMEHRGLRQADVAEIFGSQSNVSEVLNGKREINARQARALADRFGVSPASFIDITKNDVIYQSSTSGAQCYAGAPEKPRPIEPIIINVD